MQILVENSVSEAVSIPVSVPYWSCAGQVLYNMYSSILVKVTQDYLVNLLGYAEDKTLYGTFNWNIIGDEASIRSNLENFLSRFTEWTCENWCKLNNDMAESIVFASDGQRCKITCNDNIADGINVKAADIRRYVGLWLDTLITMRKQLAIVCIKASRNIAIIRRNREISLCNNVKN